MTGIISTKSVLENGPAVVGTAAFLLGTALTLLQMDAVSRRVLPADRLRAKRRAEQRHRLDAAIAHQISEIRRTLLNNGIRINLSVERAAVIDLVTDDAEMDELAKEIATKKDSATPWIIGMATDLSGNSHSSHEWYLYLAFPVAGKTVDGHDKAIQFGRRVQTPLVKFGMKLADAFEYQLTSNALCFVADASSGLGSHIIGTVAEKCQAGMVRSVSHNC